MLTCVALVSRRFRRSHTICIWMGQLLSFLWIVWSTSARLPVKIRWSISIGLFIPYVRSTSILYSLPIIRRRFQALTMRAQCMPMRNNHPPHPPVTRSIRRRLDLHLGQPHPRLYLRNPLQRHEPASTQPTGLLRSNQHRRLALRSRSENSPDNAIYFVRAFANGRWCEV